MSRFLRYLLGIFLRPMFCFIEPVTMTLAAVAAANALGSAFGGGSETASSSLTPEQSASLDALLSYANNGYFGTGGKSQIQNLTESSLLKLLQTDPTLYKQAESEYQKILADEYDPYNSKGYYANYKNSALKELADASSNLNASLGASGKFFSTSRNRALSDLNTNYTNNLNNTLASLYEDNANKKISALGNLVTLQGQKQGYALNNINAGNSYTNADTQNRLSAYNSVLGSQGGQSVSVPSTNPWIDVINSGIALGANALYNNSASGTSSKTSSAASSLLNNRYGTNNLGLWY